MGTAEGAEVSFARAILGQAGLQEGRDYEFLPVGDGGPATAAFERGEIEAYAAAISDMAIIEARGRALRELTPNEFLGFFGNGFATTRRFLDGNAGTIEGFGRALARGNEFAKQNKQATIKHCGEQNPEEARDTELTGALFDTAMARTTPLVGEDWGFFPPEHWTRWHQTLVDSGDLEKALPDLDAAYTNQFVRTSSPTSCPGEWPSGWRSVACSSRSRPFCSSTSPSERSTS